MDNILLRLENDKHILDFCFDDGAPVWFFMRYVVLYSILTPKLLGTTIIDSPRKITDKAKRYMVKAVSFDMRKHHDKDIPILFYGSARGTFTNGKFINQYFDNYVSLLDKNGVNSLIVEQAAIDWLWPENRYNDRVIYDAPLFSIDSLAAKVSRYSIKDKYKVKECMNFVGNRIREEYGIELLPNEIDRIIATTLYEATRYRIYARQFTSFCVRKNVKIVIMVGASYSWYYYFNAYLKERNIQIADLQHGYITKTNFVYNYADNICNSENVKRGAPTYLLSYGNWWNEQTNIPYKNRLAIGYPYRDSIIESVTTNDSQDDSILLIGCARNTEEYVRLARILSDRFPDKTVIFRPHPSEREYALHILAGEKTNFKLDTDNYLYKTLSQSSVLISEISTVLFEAIGLVDRIIVWRTNFSSYILSDSLFEEFETIDELLNLLFTEHVRNDYSEIFWKDNWKNNFSSFVNVVLKDTALCDKD